LSDYVNDATGPLRVCMCTPEAVPLVKTGGLADAAGGLTRALAEAGCDVRVALPAYAAIDRASLGLHSIGTADIPLGSSRDEVGLFEGYLPNTRIPVYLIAHDPSFNRPGLYGEHGVDYPDNLRRFTVYGRGVLALLRRLAWSPDVLHCHDWQTALLPVWLRVEPQDARLAGIATLLTIHNLAYQGVFDADTLPITGLAHGPATPAELEFFGRINLLKGGLMFADFLSTVSERYAAEIQTPEFGCGLDSLLLDRRGDLMGILNGADYTVWDPSVDRLLPARYTPDDLSGKALCKASLQRSQGLTADRTIPLLGLVARLVEQKGLDLVAATADAILGLGAQLTLLGTGDPGYQTLLQDLHARYPDRVAATLQFNEPLAHLIVAAADIYLMPSRYEPSGLNQLYSLRYGTVPVVRRTGGLADSITDATPKALARETATGFVFDAYTPDAFLDAVKRALFAFRNADAWHRLQVTGMHEDFSWARAAARYREAYRLAVARRRAGAH